MRESDVDHNKPTKKQIKEVRRIVGIFRLKPPREDRLSYQEFIDRWGEYARIKEADDRIMRESRKRPEG